MKKISFSIFIFLPFFFSACKNPELDKIINQREKTTHELLYETIPAWQKISTFKNEMTNAQFRNLIWIEAPGQNEEKEKQKLFVNDTYPKLKSDLQNLTTTQDKKEKIDSLILHCDNQIVVFKKIMDDLSTMISYNDPSILLQDQSMVLDSDGESVMLTKSINADFDWLISHCDDKIQKARVDLEGMSMK